MSASRGGRARPRSAPAREWSRLLPSAEATRAAGLAFGRGLARGATLPQRALVLVRGELGAGKTTFIKAACEALGIAPAVVISPTYTLVNVYPGTPTVYHVDLFRLERPEALLELDERDWINSAGPTFIEWPDVAAPLLAGRPALTVWLAHEGPGRRIRIVSDVPDDAPVFAALAALPAGP